MLKKLLLALAAVLAAYVASRCAYELINRSLTLRVRAGKIQVLTNGQFSFNAVKQFLKTIEFLGIDFNSYDDQYLADAMLNGVLWKFEAGA